jgi:hypothetical protein
MFAAKQVHGRNQSNEAEIMVAMQMANKDVAYFINLNPGFRHAKLCSLPAIDQEIRTIHLQDLSSLISIKCRRG